MASRDGFWSSRKHEQDIGPAKPRKGRRPLGFMPLEPRIMYDGAGVATAVHHHHERAPLLLRILYYACMPEGHH